MHPRATQRANTLEVQVLAEPGGDPLSWRSGQLKLLTSLAVNGLHMLPDATSSALKHSDPSTIVVAFGTNNEAAKAKSTAVRIMGELLSAPATEPANSTDPGDTPAPSAP